MHRYEEWREEGKKSKKERKHEKENDYPVYTCAAGSGAIGNRWTSGTQLMNG